MERVSKKAVATSQPFKFLIGPLQTEYTIHSALVAHQSPALDAMVNGKFQESREFAVKWDDVDEIVFSSFWQFVYTGDYDTPEPLPPEMKTSSPGDHKSDTADKAAEAEPEPGPEESEESEEPEEESRSRSESESTQMSQTRYMFYVPQGSHTSSEMEQEEQKTEEQKGIQSSLLWNLFLLSWEVKPEAIDVDISLKDQTNSLMHHAKVFTLADRYGIKRLADISQGKLYKELTDLLSKGGEYANVVELVRYTVEDLVPDQLKDMVVDFSGCVVEKLWGFKEFGELLEKHGTLSKALIGMLLSRLADSL
ncbi:hypothetical protein FOMA001_g20176 [Fusarium oxysporum f. sp. matthiolae]|nr:hypothetical protein FOMA001_g20176 [Fusarium oxysporum f. sp. matthiolae]